MASIGPLGFLPLPVRVPLDHVADGDVPVTVEARPPHLSTVKSQGSCASSVSGVSAASSASTASRGSSKRSKRRDVEQRLLRGFLQKHKFRHIDTPKPVYSMAGSNDDNIYPVHVAAAEGNYQVLRLLLANGADPEQQTSEGHLAIDFASRKNRLGSHNEVLDLLRGQVKFMSMRDFLPPVQKSRTNTIESL